MPERVIIIWKTVDFSAANKLLDVGVSFKKKKKMHTVTTTEDVLDPKKELKLILLFQKVTCAVVLYSVWLNQTLFTKLRLFFWRMRSCCAFVTRSVIPQRQETIVLHRLLDRNAATLPILIRHPIASCRLVIPSALPA